MISKNDRTALIVAFDFPPSAMAGVFRTLRFTQFLPEFGWNTAVLTSVPNPDGPLDSRLSLKVPPEVHVRQVELIRTEDVIKQRLRCLTRTQLAGRKPTFSAGLPLVAKRPKSRMKIRTWRSAFSELLFAIPDDRIAWKKDAVRAGMQMVERLKPSVIYASGPPFSALLAGREIARRAQLPLILDFRDPWTRVPWGPRNKSSLANRIVARLERQCVASAANVVLNTPQLEQDFVSHYPGFPREKFLCIPNGFDPEIQPKVAELLQKATPRRGDDRAICLLHPGSLYRNRNPRPIVEALARLNTRGINVIFEQIGSCEHSSELMAYAEQLGVASLVRILPAIAHNELLHRMAEVDGFILFQPGTALQVPGKLFEMILFKKPITAICEEGAVADIINHYQIGQVAPSGDVERIADAMQQASTQAVAAGRWDDVLRDFNGRQLSARLANVFNAISQN